MTPETINYLRALLNAGTSMPLDWQRSALDQIERAQYALGEPVGATSYTVEPAHNYSNVNILGHLSDPLYAVLRAHERSHSRVTHHHPLATVPPLDEVRYWTLRPEPMIRVTDLPGWIGWTFDIPANWNPDVPLPCPLDAILYRPSVSEDGEVVFTEPPVPDGWTRKVYSDAAIAHLPPTDAPYPGEPQP